MAFDTVQLENPRTGQLRAAPIGFSWTTFFFGPFPMMFRGAWKWFFIILVTNVITWGFAGLVWMFIINKLYLKDLINDGFRFRSALRANYEGVVQYAGIQVARVEAPA